MWYAVTIKETDVHLCHGKVLESSFISTLKMIRVKSVRLHLTVVTTGTIAMALAELELMMSSYSGGGSK